MPIRLKCLITSLLIGISCLSWSSLMAKERKPGAGGPPLAYRFAEISVHLTRQPGHDLPIQRLKLSGSGRATLERDRLNLPFYYAPENLLALLNEFYRIRFFDLPMNYRTRHSLFLKDDGTLGTRALRMSDASSTSVCYAVASYEKCVTYGTEGPYELEELVQKIFSDAERLANAGLPKP